MSPIAELPCDMQNVRIHVYPIHVGLKLCERVCTKWCNGKRLQYVCVQGHSSPFVVYIQIQTKEKISNKIPVPNVQNNRTCFIIQSYVIKSFVGKVSRGGQLELPKVQSVLVFLWPISMGKRRGQSHFRWGRTATPLPPFQPFIGHFLGNFFLTYSIPCSTTDF